MKELVSSVSLGVTGFAILFAALMLGEALSTTDIVMYLRAETQIPVTLLTAIIYLLIAAPIAFVMGRGLIRWAPHAGRSAIGIAVFLFTVTIVILQLGLYDNSVIGRSILKVVFGVSPLLWILYQGRRQTA